MMNLHSIYQNFISHEQKLNDFLTHEFSKTPALPYLSCDLRHSGFKVAVVDTNLFPAGFNNLCKVFTEQTVEEFKHYFKTQHPLCTKLLIFTEAHTRNKFYFENIYRLQEMLNQAGLDVKIATQFEEFTEDQSIVLENDKTLILHAIPQNTSLQLCDSWIPDLILSNNDFSSGIPEILQSTSIPIIPSPLLGWHRRKKSDHFKIYSEIATEIGDLIELDPWLFNSYHSQVDEID
ncbi:MAG: glutamate--cysteine ligase, partial [Deltaproteobacteria bacterium]|nr:glutamate--cysteine ligase [Deltaproteobacteria bacterium]